MIKNRLRFLWVLYKTRLFLTAMSYTNHYFFHANFSKALSTGVSAIWFT